MLTFASLLLVVAPSFAQQYQLEVQGRHHRDIHVVRGVVSVQTYLARPNSGERPTRQFAHTALLGDTAVAQLSGSPASFTVDTRLVPDGVYEFTFRIDGASDIWPVPLMWIVDNVAGPANVNGVPACGYYQTLSGTVPGTATGPACIDVPVPLPPKPSYPHPAPLATPFTSLPAKSQLIVEHILPNGALFNGAHTLWRTSHGEPVIMPLEPQFGENWDIAKNWVDRLPISDGPRNRAFVSPYIVGAVHPQTQELYFAEQGFKFGRIGKISRSGTVTTIAGYRLRAGVLPCYFRDLACDFDSQFELVGDFSEYPPGRFAAPMDLAFDLSDSTRIYVADTYNHRVALVNLATSPARVTSVAGNGTAGNQDGSAVQASFNLPLSVAATDDGVWISDRGNASLRKVSSGQVSTWLTGLASGLTSIADTIVIRSAGHGGIPNNPNAPRHLYIAKKSGIYHYRPGDGDLRFEGALPRAALKWVWIDVDRDGTFGPAGSNYNHVFVAAFGSDEAYWRFDPSTATWTTLHSPSYSYEQRADAARGGHYPWMIAVGSGAVWTAGTGTFGLQRTRLAVAGDPISQTFTQQQRWARGRDLWKAGCGSGCRWGSVPSFSTTHGPYGWNFLGFPIVEELAALSDADLSTAVLGGLGTGVARTFTATELSDLQYFIRQSSPYGVRGLNLPPPDESPPPPPPPPPPPQLRVQSVILQGNVNDPSVTTVIVNGTAVPVTGGNWQSQVNINSGTTAIPIQATGTGGTTVETVTVSAP